MSRRHALPLCLLLSLLPSCAPKADLLEGPIVKELLAGQTQGTAHLDHAPLTALFERHVRPQTGRVDYQGLKAEAPALSAYLQGTIATAKLDTLTAQEQKALLINAYNGYTLALILEHYPGVGSIRDLDDPWGAKRYSVGGHLLSLDDIEHGLLRPMFKDPRIHFAINCASIGCPPLADTAYEAQTLDAQLDAAMTRAMAMPSHAQVKDGTLFLTYLMNWYGGDFTRPDFSHTADTVPAALAPFAPEPMRAFIQSHQGDPPLSYLEYDWALNDTPK